MKPRMIALIGTAMLLAGAAATRERNAEEDDDGPRGSAAAPSAMVDGSLGCFRSSGSLAQVNLSLGTVVGVPFSGEVGPVPGPTTVGVSGACADALAALRAELPSPLCASRPVSIFIGEGFESGGFNFACGGLAGDVVDAVGDVAKALIALP